MNITEIERLADGTIVYRTDATPAGCKASQPSDIDMVLLYVASKLSIPRTGRYTPRQRVILDCCFPDATVCRLRKRFEPGRTGKNACKGIPEDWFLRLHLYSGIPINELMWVACTTPKVSQYVLLKQAA